MPEAWILGFFYVIAPAELVLGLGFLALIFWRLLRRFFSQTVLDNVPGPLPSSFLAGSLREIYSSQGWDFHQKIMEAYGSVVKLKGVFGSNTLYISNPKALYHILVKDLHVYEEMPITVVVGRVIFGEGLLGSTGDRHHAQRKLLNPAFSIAHIREMVPIFYEVGHRLQDTFLQKVANGPTEVDVAAWLTRCALELIGRSGMGYSFDTLSESAEPHPYTNGAKQLFPLLSKCLFLVPLLPIASRIGTPSFRRAIVGLIPWKPLRQLRDVVDILHNTSVEILEAKRGLREDDRALATQIGAEGKDIISILLRENMKASEEDKLSDNELMGQVTSLIFAATDTTSSALSRIFQLLALHKDVQSKLRQEILEAKLENGGKDFDYDTLVALPYLDAICRETLRLYPPASFNVREAQQDIVLPLGAPIKGTNGKNIDAIPISKGTTVYVSIIGTNRNPELWGPDACEWKPERWINPLPESLINARVPGVYSHSLTFLGGGKSCIGFKFSQLEIKLILAILLEKIEFSLSDKDIVWRMTAIATPYVDMDSTIPSLPMRLSLVNSKV